MAKLVIIADDLTGALDTGVQFSENKLSVVVTTKIDIDFQKEFFDMDVIVIDTESRHISSSEAGKKIKKILSNLPKENVEFFFKKLDSTLRGNIGSELEAFIDGLNIKKLAFMPAFPLGKRTVKNGILYVNGKKIEDTVFSKDILNPIKKSLISDIIAEQTDIFCEVSTKENFDINKEIDKKIMIFDSSNIDDLEAIAQKLEVKKLLHYTAGNTGFASVLKNYIPSKNFKKTIKIIDKRILFVCGSVNKISLEQCAFAKRSNYISKVLNFSDIVSENYEQKDSFKEVKNFTVTKLHENEKILIQTSDGINTLEIAKEYTEKNNISMEEITENIAKNTGKLISEILKEEQIENLVIFGGDTLIGILENLNYKYLMPIGEIVPGIVFARVFTKDNKTYQIITKAGGFGEENIIEEIERFFLRYSNV